MIIEISVAVIALAFAVLVIYLILLFSAVKQTLGQTNLLVNDVRKQLDDLSGEAKKTIEQANQMSADLKHKMEALDPLFNSIANVGDVLEHRAESFRQRSVRLGRFDERASHSAPFFNDSDHQESINRAKTSESVVVAEILELAGLGIRLWQKLKKRR
ncbi:conserved putative membrane protein [Candidatus Protochlamydia naegleriophila]|uniref:Conserved putative membrane protein n=1 Tax=Candidatus Protochlamydia naegleriophila TaxID=389348 RepID=A0A0U5JD20_9BACT|nr:DUF948 domain-containing protein [Candidatus Protochlamydia naegleriophila]CUI17047.1 conserved putative membrane protein [Candidatus Protochlamydia naegleriophila]